jgi:hypothetical protein
LPGTCDVSPSVLVIERSARGVSVSVSVDVLLAPVGSLLPAGAATLAVLTNEPVAFEEIVAVTVNVAVPEMARLMLALMLPLPDAGQLEPAVAEQLHVALVSVAGNESVTVAPLITDGPAFDATIVYVTPCPGTADAAPSVFVIDKSPVGVNVSVSVAELFAGVGSVTAAGTATVAVLTRLPVAIVEIVDVRVNVAVPPGASVTVALMLPLPEAGQVEPAEAAHVHVAPARLAGNVSVTVAPVTVDGPAFEATIVYVTDVPGTSPVAPSVFVIDRSAVGVSVSVSVAELFAGVGSVTPAATAAVALLTSEPVAVDAIVAVRVNVAVPAGNRSTVVAMFPMPDAGHVEPADAAHVHVDPDNEPGKVSVMVVPTAADAPAFEATMVYVTLEPGTSVALPSVLVIDTSALRVTVVVSVAELLAGVGSVDPPGRATAAVFDSVPVAVETTVALTVNVTEPAARTLTDSAMLPEPDAGQLEPADAVQVHVTPVRLAGTVSVTVAVVIAEGPAFDATIV